MAVLALALAVPSWAGAGEATEAAALRTASEFFLSGAAGTPVSGARLVKVADSQSLLHGGSSGATASSEPTFYVFAPETGAGFVIVSADDATKPILGYSFRSRVPATGDLPCNFKAWARAVDRRATALREGGGDPMAERGATRWDTGDGRSAVQYETAAWAQDGPFMLQCPMDGDSLSYAGCGPVSLCIAMRYHRWPERGQGGTVPYYTYTNGTFVDARDLEHAYDWDLMPMEYVEGEYTREQADAVAELAADVGAAIFADYTSHGTGIEETWIVLGDFAGHFGYAPRMRWEYAPGYGQEDWEWLLRDELASGNGPVVFAGYSEEEGHMFIVDGFTDDGYFSFNWGWGGALNGYYALTGMAYSAFQCALIDFMPDDGGTREATLKLVGSGLRTDAEAVAPGEAFTVYADSIINASGTPFTGSLRLALTDGGGEVREWISRETELGEELPPGWCEVDLDGMECVIQGDIAAGDRIRLFHENESTMEWKVTRPFYDGSWELVLDGDGRIAGTGTVALSTGQADCGGALYDISGRKAADPAPPGIYVRDGRKVLVR